MERIVRAWLKPSAFLLVILASVPRSADVYAEGAYLIQPGDALRISVWKEEDLQQDVLVRPDGGISFPLAGDMLAAGKSTTTVQQELIERIEQYIPDPVVTVQTLQLEGNKVYVLGKVNRPGEFPMTRNLDVTQALAVAGGLAVFADADSISILRREDGVQKAIEFDYSDVQYGRSLEQNIMLKAGDIVVVP